MGKIIVMTGATSGVGREAACQLAALGAELLIGARDAAKADETVKEIQRRAPGAKVTHLPLDCSSKASIRDFAARVRAHVPRLDVLVNNAGVSPRQRRESVDGIELTFATNVLGYWLLTHELLDLLKASAPARIVNTASTFTAPPDLDDVQFARRPFRYPLPYQESKAADRMLTWALARRLEGSKVTANAFSPGMIMTGLYRDAPLPMRVFLRGLVAMIGQPLTEGAAMLTWLASSPDAAGLTGKMFYRRKEIPCQFRDQDREERLWRMCEELAR